MRLLERNSAGDFILTKNFVDDDEVPPYAILSHTWGADAEEVTFEDLTNGIGRDKAGYEKLRFCGDQVKFDGLRYFWVDTCCINKANFTELSQAINSMFRWYRKAAKCYVYLSDVSTTKRKASEQSFEVTWEPAFRKSRWFSRGWTLQELLAPSSVEFFSRDRKRLGDKRTLEHQIHEVTKIAVSALRGTSPSQFSVEERFSWSKDRRTTHKEDKVYSLLGIFDVHMPLIYGEGEENALNRLRREIEESSNSIHQIRQRLLTSSSGLEIDQVGHLPYAAEATFNSYAKQHEPTCLPNTRVDLLHNIYSWADGQDERCIFWLNGLAGTGKSTIARTVARKYFKEKRLGASFFFSRGGGDVGHAGKFCTTVAVQLAEHIPTLRRHVCDAITDRSNIVSLSLEDQWRQLVFNPLSKLDGNGCSSSYVLVIDALDECDDDKNIRIILQLLAEARSLKRVRLRVFLTSRPEVPIRLSFYQLPERERHGIVLHNISPLIVDHDILVFLEHNFKLIREENCQDAGWPGAENIKSLVRRANGLFIWAATACRFISEGRSFADDRLSIIILNNGSVDESVTDESPTDDNDDADDDAAIAPEEHLNTLYITVLQNSAQNFKKQEKKNWYKLMRQTIGAVIVLCSPLSIHSLAGVLHVSGEGVTRILNKLRSIFEIPENHAQPIRLHHPSFRDFLLDRKRCTDSHFWVDEKQAHQTLTECCVQLLSKSLKQDICGLEAPGVFVAEVDNSRVEKYLPQEVQYACLYWVEHLQMSGVQLYDNDQVHQFLHTHFLHWLEALSWMKRMSEGILAIRSLKSIALVSLPPARLKYTTNP